MNKVLLLYASFMLAGTFISSVAQVMLKKAALKQYDSVLREYLNPRVIFAYVLFFGATLLSIYAYKVVPLSMGPILEATGYIYVTVFSVAIFHETIDRKKLLALGMIIVGIVIYAVFG
ncbi:MAG: multidrug ABC transporter [Ruminococcaceae bacterium]|nr:multidrug ABC transporter [Oscillospiraceae bacterium]